jgi:hypothetical protein
MGEICFIVIASFLYHYTITDWLMTIYMEYPPRKVFVIEGVDTAADSIGDIKQK